MVQRNGTTKEQLLEFAPVFKKVKGHDIISNFSYFEHNQYFSLELCLVDIKLSTVVGSD